MVVVAQVNSRRSLIHSATASWGEALRESLAFTNC